MLSLQRHWIYVLAIGLVAFVALNLYNNQTLSSLKTELIRHLNSRSELRTSHALSQLRTHGWLADGSLHGLNLSQANFIGADLNQVDLATAILKQTVLAGGKLRGADLRGVDLSSAVLFDADLYQASLRRANLSGAILSHANLEGADLTGAEFSLGTIMPDYRTWTPDMDLGVYTDPLHPQFWRSNDPYSPAYRPPLIVAQQ